MAQRSKIFLAYNPAFNPEQQFLFRNAVLIVNDLTELYGYVNDINRTIAALPSTGFTAGQDLSGTATLQTVIGLQNIPIAAAIPLPNDVLTFDGAQWIGTAPIAGFITSIDNTGNDVTLSVPGGVLSANLASILVSQFTNDAGYITSAGTPALTATRIGFGDAGNLLTGSASLTWNDTAKDLNATGTISLVLANSANVFYVAQGNVGYWFTGAASTGLLAHQGFGIDMKTTEKYTMGSVGLANNNYFEINDSASTATLSTLAGVGTRMVTASATGVLSTAAIPTGTVTNVSGTANRITSTGGTTPVIDIAAAYDALWQPVNANLTTIGGLTVARGRIIVGSAAPAWSTLALGGNGTILRSDGSDLKYTTAGFADTYTASNILYSNGANNVTGLATANSAVLVTSAGGVPSLSAVLPAVKLGSLTTDGFVKTSAGDGTLSVDTNTYARTFATSTTSTTVTGTIAETLLTSVLVPANTVTTGNILTIKPRFTKTGTAGSWQVRIRIHTSAALAGNTISNPTGTSAFQIAGLEKIGLIKSTTSTEFGSTAMVTDSSFPAAAAPVSYSIDWTIDQYIIFTVQLANTGDTGVNSGYTIMIQ